MNDAKLTETIKPELAEIAGQAFLKISVDEGYLRIKHLISLSDKLIWAIFFFSGGGIFLIVIPLFEGADVSSTVASITVGILSLSLAGYVFLKVLNDQVKFDGKKIEFRDGWKTVSLPLVSCKSATMKIKRVTYKTSMIIEIKHFIRSEHGGRQIFTFNMDYSDSDTAIKLGKQLTNLINQQISNTNLL